MTFFSRPILSDEQFKQLSGTTLTLSGTTRIASTTGFSISPDGGTTYIPIIVTGATYLDVLTYKNGQIVLAAPTASGGTGVYTCASPTTITVGGLPAGCAIYGCSVNRILEEILVPTCNPTLTPPSSTFSTSITNPYEIGTVVHATGCIAFNRGCICPAYGTSGYRSGLPTSFNYVDFNGGTCRCVGGAPLTCTYSMPAYTVVCGSRIAYGSVSYSIGEQPKNSSGGTYCTPLASGTTTPIPSVICGIYPYFYGKVASGGCPAGVNRPAATCALVIAGTKCVCNSSGSIYINFNSTSDDYIWFAIPSGSTKTCWCVNALNNGAIGGAVSAGGNLFPARASVCPVTTACWSGQAYNVYISNYQSATNTLMTIS